MITEYHLAGHTQGSSSLSPVLLEAATELLPPLDKYTGGVGFHGMRDMGVVARAKTLRIATWLHRLHMVAAEKDQIASQTLEAARHKKGPLVDLVLAPMMGNLTFAEVVGQVLDEGRCHEESSLANLQGCCTRIRGELDDLVGTRQVESDASTGRRLKREIDLWRKDIENLKVAISHHQSNPGQGESGVAAPDDNDSSDHEASEATESEMAIAPETGDTPSVSVPERSSDSPPAKGQSHAMEVDDEQGNPPPASPAGARPTLKETWPTLRSRLLRTQMVVARMPLPRRLLCTCLFGRHSRRVPPGRLQEGSEATVMDGRRGPWILLRNQPDDRERDDQPEETPDEPLFEANFVNL